MPMDGQAQPWPSTLLIVLYTMTTYSLLIVGCRRKVVSSPAYHSMSRRQSRMQWDAIAKSSKEPKWSSQQAQGPACDKCQAENSNATKHGQRVVRGGISASLAQPTPLNNRVGLEEAM
jgi:hypothetical protein